MKISFIAIAAILFLSVGVPAHAENDDKQIIHDKVTDSLLKTCRGHEQHVSTWDHGKPLSEPIYSDRELVAWVTAALPNIMSLDAAKIEQELLDGEKYFTPYGWCEFIAATSDAGLIDATITRKLQVRMVPHAAPKITESVARNGVYSWAVETPVSFTFTKGDVRVSDLPDIDGEMLVLRISRSSSKTNPDGIGILQWVVVPDHS